MFQILECCLVCACMEQLVNPPAPLSIQGLRYEVSFGRALSQSMLLIVVPLQSAHHRQCESSLWLKPALFETLPCSPAFAHTAMGCGGSCIKLGPASVASFHMQSPKVVPIGVPASARPRRPRCIRKEAECVPQKSTEASEQLPQEGRSSTCRMVRCFRCDRAERDACT